MGALKSLAGLVVREGELVFFTFFYLSFSCLTARVLAVVDCQSVRKDRTCGSLSCFVIHGVIFPDIIIVIYASERAVFREIASAFFYANSEN